MSHKRAPAISQGRRRLCAELSAVLLVPLIVAAPAVLDIVRHPSPVRVAVAVLLVCLVVVGIGRAFRPCRSGKA